MNEITSEIVSGIAGYTPGVSMGGPGSFQRGVVPDGPLQLGSDSLNFDGIIDRVDGHKLDLETSPIQYAYLCPPGGEDASARYAMPDMPAFSINGFDPEEGSTMVVTAAKLNYLMYTSFREFERASDPTNPEHFADAEKFKGYLQTYGEAGLETYHQARRTPYLMRQLEKNDKVHSELGEFYKMASEELFCWLTKFGILGMVNYLGPIITNGRDVTLEAQNDVMGADHYTVFNVALAKRCTIANTFGSIDNVTTGAVAWFVLRRKEVVHRGKVTSGEFMVVPYCNKNESSPPQSLLYYQDESGRSVRGHRWCVGKIISPPKRSPSEVARSNAANTGIVPMERLAYEDHGALPVLTIAAGFK